MELVYLWVEKYKNIEKQGFNFSPKFRCEYNPDTEELKIEENPNYVSIFPDNINITAIVGKNGSGKSNLLEFISKLCDKNTKEFAKNYNYLVITYKKNKLNVFSNNTLKVISEIPYNEEKEHFCDDFRLLFFNFNDIFSNDKYGNYLSNPLNKYDIESFKFFNRNDIYLKFIASIFKILKQNSLKYFSNSYIFLPKKIYLNLYFGNFCLFENKDAKDCYFEYKEMKKKDNFSILEEFLLKIYEIESKNPFYKVTNNEEELKNIINNMKQFFEIKLLKENVFEINDELSFILMKDKPNIILELKLKDNFEINEDTIKNITKILELLIYFSYGYNEQSYKLMEFDILGENINNECIYFNNLSQGEKILIILDVLITVFKEKHHVNLILFDEVFNDLHPDWQKRIVDYLINKITSNEKSNIILTTHSPFIISDLPKENIIFLDKDENGKCKVVDGLNEKKETFGANIHTLLSDSFFMEDGLMGKFAESEIYEVIRYLNGEKIDNMNDKKAQKIINIIGEPILRKELQRKLDSKRLSKIKEVDKIKREMRMLKNRMKELERLLNEKNNNN